MQNGFLQEKHREEEGQEAAWELGRVQRAGDQESLWGSREGKFLEGHRLLCQGPQTPPDLPPNTDSVTLPEELLLCVCVCIWVSGYLFKWLLGEGGFWNSAS